VVEFSAPAGTTGSVSLPGVEDTLVSKDEKSVKLVNGEANGLDGEEWKLECSNDYGESFEVTKSH
jgi:hypothetical protein